MDVLGALLRVFGWNLRMKRLRWGLRVRQYLTLATVMVSIGTAVGYAVATRRVTEEGRYADPDRTE